MMGTTVSLFAKNVPSNTGKPRSVPRWIYAALAVATFAYLLVEVPFAADLLDVLSSAPDHAAIEDVEHVGRLISGSALALALAGFLIPFAYRSSWPVMKTLAWTVIVCVGSVYGVYHGEKSLIDTIAENTSAEFRQGAAFAVLAKEEVIGGAGIKGFSIDKSDPASLVFAAFMPAAARADSVIFDSFNRSEKAALASSSMTDNVLSMQDFREKVLKRALDETESRREMLQSRRASYGMRASDAVEFAETNWARAREAIQYRIDTGNFTSGYRQVAINAERSRGIPLKSDFFANKDWASVYKKTAREAYFGNLNKRYRQQTGENVPTEMTWPAEDRNEFYKVSSVQRDLKKAMGVDGFGGTVSPTMTQAAEKALYAAVKADAVEDFRGRFFQKAAVFGPRGLLQDAGVDAARMVLVPLFAIGLSLLGAFVHVCKLANFAMLFAAPSMTRMPMVRIAVSLVVGVGSAAMMYETPKDLVSQPYVERAKDLMVRDMGKPAAMVLEASMSVQRSFYPAAKALGAVSPLKALENGGVQVADLEKAIGFVGSAVASETAEADVKLAPAKVPVPTPARRG